MADWLIDYGSWCLAPFGLLGMWVVGLKKRWGWVVSMTTQSLWAFYAIGTGQYGFLIGTLSYFVVYLRNWLHWRPAADPLEVVTRLLVELNTLELEKDRDGSAEQPWWYIRDDFMKALDLQLPDELPEDDEELTS